MRKSQSTARIRQGARMDHTSPSEAVGLMGNLAVGDTASIYVTYFMTVGRSRGEGWSRGEGRSWGDIETRGDNGARGDIGAQAILTNFSAKNQC